MNLFAAYETGLIQLLERLEHGTPEYHETLVYQQRLLENIEEARKYGDTGDRRVERSKVLDALNRLAEETLGVSFNTLCAHTTSASPPDPEPTAPFVGPRPFHLQDANLFFGRERCLSKLVDKLLNEDPPLLIVNGLSGVGKTSLLRAGLIPQLQEREYVAVYTSILDSPESDVIQGILATAPLIEGSSSINMVETVNRIACPPNRPIFLIIDQLERCFTLTEDREELLGFWRGLAHLVRGQTRCRVKVVGTIRSDWLHAFQTVPTPLDISVYDFLFLVNPLTKDEAREALVGPLKQRNISYEPEVIEAIVNDLVNQDYVNPPQLQIVGMTLYRKTKESQRTGTDLNLQDYNELLGASAIIREHLANTVNNLGPDAQIGWQILLKLVGLNKQRASKREEDLAGNLSSAEFDRIIGQLIKARLVVRELSSADKLPVYTLTHDYLIEEIDNHFRVDTELQAWRTAESFLDIGVADWREARETTGQELLLERERYLHICRYRERLGSLSEDASELLMRTGLYYGEPTFAYWLMDSRNEHYQSKLQTIVNLCLHGNHDRRQTSKMAVTKAIGDGQLTDVHRQHLRKLLYSHFGDKQKSLVLDSAQLPKKERQEIAATLLWSLTQFPAKLRFAPFVTRSWVSEHRTHVIISIVGIFLLFFVALGGPALQESLQGRWHSLKFFAGPIQAAAMPFDGPDMYIVTQKPYFTEDPATLLWSPGGNEWQILSPAFTYGQVAALLITDSGSTRRIYVSVVSRGILRSDNNGASWELMNNGLRSFAVGALVADPLNSDVIYAGTRDRRGVFATLDGGDTWQSISNDELATVSIPAMASTVSEGGTLLAGTDDGRIFAYKRSSQKWQLVSAYPGVGEIVTMSAEPELGQYVYAGTTNGNLLVSHDGGVSWVLLKKIPSVFGINSIAVVPGQPSVVYMNGYGIGGHLLWKSEDSGQNWREASNEFTREEMRWLLIPRQEPTKLFIAGLAGFFESGNGESSWNFHSRIESPVAPIDNIAISPLRDGPIYASVGGAVFFTSKLNQSAWGRDRGLLAESVRDIVPDPTNPYVAYAGVYLTNKWSVYMTLDGGKTWQATSRPSGIPERYLNDTTSLDIAVTERGTILYAGTNGCGVIHTTDEGSSWETWGRQDCLIPSNAPKHVVDLVIDPHSPERVYVAADSTKFFVSQDRGHTWESYATPVTTEIAAIEADPVVKGRVYLIAGAEGFWRSDDSGKTWASYSRGLRDNALSTMVTDPFAAETVIVGTINGDVLRTTDGGRSWQSIRENLVVSDVWVVAAGGPDVGVLLASRRDGLYQYQHGSLTYLWRKREEVP